MALVDSRDVDRLREVAKRLLALLEARGHLYPCRKAYGEKCRCLLDEKLQEITKGAKL